MEILYPRCAGLDIHKKTVVACRLRTLPDGKVQRETCTFGTTTRELLRLQDWLAEWEITHVAMESTGEYWRPVHNLLEGHFTLLLVNPQHIKNVPGRKTDVKDAEWLADLLRHGLLRGSFVPERPQRELRALTRARGCLVRDRNRVANRLQRVLEDTGVKLASVATDIQGASAQAMLAALARGETDPAALAELARGSLRSKREALTEALEGHVTAHHRFLLTQHLEQLRHLAEQVEAYDREIERHLEALSARPGDGEDSAGSAPASHPEHPAATAEPGRASAPTYAQALALLDPIPGLGPRNAQAILAETGVDMGRFPSEGHLARWAGVAPGNRRSGGKERPSRAPKGNSALKKTLVGAAHSAARTRGTVFKALFHRVAARRGKGRAIVAVARHLLIVVYHVLLHQAPYRELGDAYLDEQRKEQTAKHLTKRLEKLGYDVELTPTAA